MGAPRACAKVVRMHPTEEAIHRTLAQTLLAGRLAPGTQLVETRLAQVFGVSRERVRKVLHRLGHERLLDLMPNRGCFVSNPTLAQAREIYDARRIIEGGIVGSLAGTLSPSQLEALAEHERREHAALHAGDRAASIRLSGEYHLLLAEFTGSPFVVRQLQELVSRTAMLVAFFEPASASGCGCEEHEAIAQALRRGDAAGAMKAMQVHLSLIETRLKPRAAPEAEVDAEQTIAEAWADAQAGLAQPTA
ncbi:GntR family transcriptional regulator [Pseudacidovorax intermedius]|uniref:GntR family transcriptional regulator n=2 Tax=Pseudacidovorax intermedius TaxID=433924 RepID=A0A370FR99_9BURK|nr:GntR family transcriptional regulator [Pseudacidovorax intermedius]